MTYLDEDGLSAILELLKVDLLDLYHPVNSVILRFDDTDPSELFGGVWEQITDVFIRAANDLEIGGEDEVTLIGDNLPYIEYWGTAGTLNKWNIVTSFNSGSTYGIRSLKIGDNVPHNNMPKYQNMYCWRRIS